MADSTGGPAAGSAHGQEPSQEPSPAHGSTGSPTHGLTTRPTGGPAAGSANGPADGPTGNPAAGPIADPLAADSTSSPAEPPTTGPAADPAPRPADGSPADRATSPSHGPVDGPATASANGSVRSPAQAPAAGRPDGPAADPAPPSADGPAGEPVGGTAVLTAPSTSESARDGRSVEGTLPAGPVRPDAHREQPPDATPEFDWLDEEWAARNGYRTPERPAPSATDEKHTGSGRQGGRRPERGRLTRWLRGVGGFGAAVRPAWIAALALVGCGVAHLPLRDGVPWTYAHGVSLGISTLCLLLGAALVVRRSAVPVLAAGMLFPAVLAVAHLTAGRLASPLLADVLATGGDTATLAAALAAVLALIALLGALTGEVRTTREKPGQPEAPGTPGTPGASEEPVPASARASGS
ncbi:MULTISPECIES: hypothetical protein [unclassified Streptomyces]|uniref:hypothetical protein n=1 Tax=unclassified Streptomyces TaxID=2593676 RepID=UPI00131C09B4|nr:MULTISPECIES: hypothetical protein [unclassified Streptomyces]